MTRSDSLRGDLAKLKTTEASLLRDRARHESDAGKARAAASKKRKEAATTKSDASRRTATSAAEREDVKVVTATKRIGEITTKLASNNKDQASKQTSITSAERSERQATDREDERRRTKEKTHAREISRLNRPTVQYVHVQPPQPEALRVLYVTANPSAIDYISTAPDGTTETMSQYLRLDREVREVQRVLRGAKYRDLVDVELRPAATVQDLVDALNDVRPHLVHFSGHGWRGGIVFDNGELHEPTDHDVPFDMLAKVLAATGTPPLVLILNACETLAEARILLPAVPIVVAMADAIDDTATIVFARAFYAAIASAQPVGRAMAQARNAMTMTTPDDADLPQVIYREDLDPETLVLVRPEP